jgi:hypothetical protein
MTNEQILNDAQHLAWLEKNMPAMFRNLGMGKTTVCKQKTTAAKQIKNN